MNRDFSINSMRASFARLPGARSLFHFFKRVTTFSNYPRVVATSGANSETMAFLKSIEVSDIAEVGVYRGDTSLAIAEHLNGRGRLFLFDFEDKVNPVVSSLCQKGFTNVVAYANSRLLMDSYDWSLMKLLVEHQEPIFDYVFLDGAHTWQVDALAFFLLDRLVRVGGYIDFDDNDWSLANSPSLRPEVFPATKRSYTKEQIEERHVQLIIDLLVKRSDRYDEIVPNKIFRKRA